MALNVPLYRDVSNLTMSQLRDETQSTESSIEFCKSIGLLHWQRRCPRCRRQKQIVKKATTADGIGWRCNRPCRRAISIRKGTFFEKSKLSFAKILLIIYHWVFEDASIRTLHQQLNLSPVGCVDWRSFCRDICAEYFLAHPVVVGGPGIIVEIGKSMFMRQRQIADDEMVAEQWVFGGIEVATPEEKSFMVAVPQQNAATLLPIIEKYVAPGSTVVSDCWAEYNTLAQQDYQWLTENYNIQFESPVDGAGTNHLDCYWKDVKTRSKRNCGTARTQLDSYLIEHMWRRRFSSTPLQSFIEHVRAVYPTT